MNSRPGFSNVQKYQESELSQSSSMFTAIVIPVPSPNGLDLRVGKLLLDVFHENGRRSWTFSRRGMKCGVRGRQERVWHDDG